MKYKHSLLYVKDKSGTVYKSIGYTDREELVVAPKYIPDTGGDRKNLTGKYTALNFPFQSLQLIYDYPEKLKFSKLYNNFLPIYSRSEIEILDPKERLRERLNEQNAHMRTVKSLLSDLMKVTGLKLDHFGLDASLLCGLEKESSDIDLLVYNKEHSLKCFKALHNLQYKRNKFYKDPLEERELYIYRRQPYSLLMTEEEILNWEGRKISFVYKGTKVSILPIDDSVKSESLSLISTGQFAAISGVLGKDQIVFEPGDIQLKDVEIIYGPDIKIDEIHTIIPVRTGVFLQKKDKIFATGIIYEKIINGKSKYILAQMPWDYYRFYKRTGVAFIIKIDSSILSKATYRGILKAIAANG